MGGACVSKASTPNCPPRHLHVVPLLKLSAWWTTEFSPVYANPTSLNKEEEGRMVKDTDAGDGVSVKTPGGRQQETTSLLFPRIWLVRSIRNNANDVNGIFSSAGYVASDNGGDEASGVVIQRNPHIKIGIWKSRTCLTAEH